MFKLVYAGFDKLDIAFKGALPATSLELLLAARDKAAERQEPILITLGPGKVAMHVSEHGMRGGYAFVGDTGPLGSKLFFKNNIDPEQWNVFASPRATALLAYGYHGVRDRLWATLENMGARVVAHSVNRVDFAMDFATQKFELSLAQFIAHPHTKVRPHWNKNVHSRDTNQPSAILRGRRLESVTVGKMPGRQIIVYDKRREAIEHQKYFWFTVWGIERANAKLLVWRVEIRAGKKELKERWNIHHLQDLDASIGDIASHALREVRYVADLQTDSNVTRQVLHPIWIAAQQTVARQLADFRSGLMPGQIVEIERELAKNRYAGLVVGNALGYAVAHGLRDEEILASLPTLIAECTDDAIKRDRSRITKTVRRARDRLHFVT